MVSFFVAMVTASIVGYMVLAEGIFYNGASGSVSVVNKSTIINDTTGDKMSVAVDVSFGPSGSNSQFTLPSGTLDTSVNIGLYTSDGDKLWITQPASLPLSGDISLKLAQTINKKDYYRTYPDANVSGNTAKVFIYGGISKKMYYESDVIKLFDYEKPFNIASASPMIVNPGDKFLIQGSGFTLEKIKGVYMDEISLTYNVLSPNQIEVQIPSTAVVGKYKIHIVSKDELFDLYLSEKLSIVNMNVTSVSPLSPLKNTKITLKGIGFVANKINAVFIGDIIVPYTIVSPTEISVVIPNDFVNGVYDVNIESINLEKYPAPNKITIANMSVESIEPTEVVKSTKEDAYFYINGSGFFNDKVSKIFVGQSEIDWEIINDTKIKVFIPTDFAVGIHKVEILTNENLNISAGEVSVKDATSTSVTNKTNSSNNSGNSSFASYKGIVPKCNITGNLNSSKDDFAEPCGFNALIELVNNTINFLLVWFATPLAAIILVYAGFTYLTSGGSSEKATKAKHMLTSMIIGYIIALAAWLIIKTILSTLGFEGSFNLLG